MKALLTSNGVTNPSIRAALVELLGRPIEDATALFVPTAIYPFPGGAYGAGRAISGEAAPKLAGVGWKSLGILELTALPQIDREAWAPTVREADALLFWGGDPLFLAHWIRQSGLAELLPELRPEAVWVGVSAGSIAAAGIFVETYVDPPAHNLHPIASENVVFTTPDGDADRILVTGRGAGLVDVAVIPHLEHPDHADASLANAELWASRIPRPTYALDDQSAVSVVDGEVSVVSEGTWRLFNA